LGRRGFPGEPLAAEEAERVAGSRTREALRFWGPLALIGVAVFVLRAFRLATSWELFVDEITYLHLAERVRANLHVTLYGEPFYLHPPAFFFVEAGYLDLLSPSGDVIQRVYAARYLNVAFAGISSMLLYLIGRRLAGWPAGAAAALMFGLDPFVIRTNSRNMLETLAVMWVLLGIWLIVRASRGRRESVPLRYQAAGGVAFGLALLTKDMTAFLTVVPLAVCFVFGWSLPRRVSVQITVIAALTYAVYPVVIVAIGDWQRFEAQKFRGLSRFSGAVKETGFTRSGGPSFSQAMLNNLAELGTTYALIGIGAAAVGVLLLAPGAANRLVAVWAGSAYSLIVYSMAFGTLEEQFFYFLVVPSILAIPVAAACLFGALNLRGGVQPGLAAGAAVLLGVFVVWSSVVWVDRHTTADNGYERLTAHLAQHVPHGSRIAVTTETAEFIMDDYQIGRWTSLDALRMHDAEYVIISTKEVGEGYGYATPEFYVWVRQNAQLVVGFEGPTNQMLALYRLPESF
jgi:hypothetical protein